MIAPKKPKLTKNVERIDAAYVRSRHRSMGTIASAVRDSMTTKIADRTSPSAMKPPTVASVQSAPILLVRPTSRKLMPTVKTAAPR